jgi:hypothetical protein
VKHVQTDIKGNVSIFHGFYAASGYNIHGNCPDLSLTTAAAHQRAVGASHRKHSLFDKCLISPTFNLLNTKRNLLYIRHQSVPRCKHRLQKPISS